MRPWHDATEYALAKEHQRIAERASMRPWHDATEYEAARQLAEDGLNELQ